MCQFNDPVGEPSVELAIRGDGSIILWVGYFKDKCFLLWNILSSTLTMFVGNLRFKDNLFRNQ